MVPWLGLWFHNLLPTMILSIIRLVLCEYGCFIERDISMWKRYIFEWVDKIQSEHRTIRGGGGEDVEEEEGKRRGGGREQKGRRRESEIYRQMRWWEGKIIRCWLLPTPPVVDSRSRTTDMRRTSWVDTDNGIVRRNKVGRRYSVGGGRQRSKFLIILPSHLRSKERVKERVF